MSKCIYSKCGFFHLSVCMFALVCWLYLGVRWGRCYAILHSCSLWSFPCFNTGRTKSSNCSFSYLQHPCNSPFLLYREDPTFLLALKMFIFPSCIPLPPTPQRELKSFLIFNSAFFSFLCVDWDGIPVPTLLCYFFCIPSHPSLEHRCSEYSHGADLELHPAPAPSFCSCLQHPKLCYGPFSAPVPS